MKYLITITKVEKVESIDRSYEKLADTGNERDKGSVYGYVEYPTTKNVSTQVLSQEVENINLVEVIKAINDIN